MLSISSVGLVHTRQHDYSQKRVTLFSSYRSHVAFFKCPSFGGVYESSSYRSDSQLVAPILSASEMLLEETASGGKQTAF